MEGVVPRTAEDDVIRKSQAGCRQSTTSSHNSVTARSHAVFFASQSIFFGKVPCSDPVSGPPYQATALR